MNDIRAQSTRRRINTYRSSFSGRHDNNYKRYRIIIIIIIFCEAYFVLPLLRGRRRRRRAPSNRRRGITSSTPPYLLGTWHKTHARARRHINKTHAHTRSLPVRRVRLLLDTYLCVSTTFRPYVHIHVLTVTALPNDTDKYNIIVYGRDNREK